VLAKLRGEYERAYYSGVISERWGKGQLRRGAHPSLASGFFLEAMDGYAKAMASSPPETTTPSCAGTPASASWNATHTSSRKRRRKRASLASRTERRLGELRARGFLYAFPGDSRAGAGPYPRAAFSSGPRVGALVGPGPRARRSRRFSRCRFVLGVGDDDQATSEFSTCSGTSWRAARERAGTTSFPKARMGEH